jgi:hypothetical protein
MGRHKGVDREIWWVNKKGYIEGRVYRNGVCRQVKQSRWIIEQYLGRKLYPTEIVHHKNEDRQDNRIENLEVKTNGRHTTDHQLGKPKTRGRRNNISPEERQRRSDFMKEVHRRRQENDPTNSWYGQRKG